RISSESRLKELWLRITFAASEGVPYSKTGGLADVVGALPKALAAMGHELTVFLPRYRRSHLTEAHLAIANLTVPMQDYLLFCKIKDAGSHDGLQFSFADHPEFSYREDLFGASPGVKANTAGRFPMFCRAVIDSTNGLGRPDVFPVMTG